VQFKGLPFGGSRGACGPYEKRRLDNSMYDGQRQTRLVTVGGVEFVHQLDIGFVTEMHAELGRVY